LTAARRVVPATPSCRCRPAPSCGPGCPGC
jgi:hypothetical protein